jgi:hypothetical protein
VEKVRTQFLSLRQPSPRYIFRIVVDTLQSLAQFISGITTIGEDVAQPGIARADRSKDAWSAVAILNAASCTTSPTRFPWVS